MKVVTQEIMRDLPFIEADGDLKQLNTAGNAHAERLSVVDVNVPLTSGDAQTAHVIGNPQARRRWSCSRGPPPGKTCDGSLPHRL